MKLTIEQVRKGGLPPLIPNLIERRNSGGKPPSVTCSVRCLFFDPATEKHAMIYRPPTTGHYY